LLSRKESDRALVLAQAVTKETKRFSSRLKRLERARAKKKKSAKAVVKPIVPKKVVKTKPEVKSAVKKIKPSAGKVQMRKRARGAYGRSVKMMIDIKKLKGEKYFPNKISVLKKELARIKVLLKGEKYATAIEYAEKIYPKMKKLKASCQKKENARKAMPTNW
jgi:hypothetical protein